MRQFPCCNCTRIIVCEALSDRPVICHRRRRDAAMISAVMNLAVKTRFTMINHRDAKPLTTGFRFPYRRFGTGRCTIVIDAPAYLRGHTWTYTNPSLRAWRHNSAFGSVFTSHSFIPSFKRTEKGSIIKECTLIFPKAEMILC